MEICAGIDETRERVRAWKSNGLRVAFVPTMGNLHAGHLALVERARARADRVMVSIFVNPLQFNQADDFSAYPRTLQQDIEQLRSVGADGLFTPTEEHMYPQGQAAACKVTVPLLGDLLEGEFRPGHFTGVTTVVNKLFNIVQPDLAVFGEKDFQQLMLVRQMVRDLNMPIEIDALPTVRESDGLAMSSRNGRLNDEQRHRAPALYRILRQVADQVSGGHSGFSEQEQWGMAALGEQGFRPEYLVIRRSADLQPPEKGDNSLVILVAAWLGPVRLIDNIPIDPNLNP